MIVRERAWRGADDRRKRTASPNSNLYSSPALHFYHLTGVSPVVGPGWVRAGTKLNGYWLQGREERVTSGRCNQNYPS